MDITNARQKEPEATRGADVTDMTNSDIHRRRRHHMMMMMMSILLTQRQIIAKGGGD